MTTVPQLGRLITLVVPLYPSFALLPWATRVYAPGSSVLKRQIPRFLLFATATVMTEKIAVSETQRHERAYLTAEKADRTSFSALWLAYAIEEGAWDASLLTSTMLMIHIDCSLRKCTIDGCREAWKENTIFVMLTVNKHIFDCIA